jgi:protein-tyrosine-phosphatase
MSTEPPLILIIGAADTGRAPMAAALLRRLLAQRGLEWRVASAGVVGHDDEPAQPEARDAIAMLNLDISQHLARSLSAELAEAAQVLLAIDSGVARVLQARHPEAPAVSLGELAGRRRDIPDPFRMQVGAWVSYAREIEDLLSAGLDRLVALVQGGPPPPPEEAAASAQPDPPPQADPPAAEPRRAAVERCARVLTMLIEMPGVVDWAGASRQMAAELPTMGAPLSPQDLSRPYAAIVQAMLGLTPQAPTPGQAARLRDALSALRAPISADDLSAISAGLASYPQL